MCLQPPVETETEKYFYMKSPQRKKVEAAVKEMFLEIEKVSRTTILLSSCCKDRAEYSLQEPPSLKEGI